MLLKDKTVLITGANGALGQAVAIQAASFGAKQLVLVDVTPDISTDAISAASSSVTLQTHSVDLTDTTATEKLFEQAPNVDVVCNIAGGFDMGSTVFDTSDKDWQFMFAINVSTMQNTIKACVPRMIKQGGGAIVNVGALGALQGQALMSAYTASKSVVMRLTESLADEVKEQSINVNAVLPNVIDTARNRADMPDADYSKWVRPEDLANVICLLGSDLSSAMHGALVPVRGLA